jgi:ethanolamine ammonia-lyase small subunit
MSTPPAPPALVDALPARQGEAAIAPDPWAALRSHTPARIGIGRAGTSLPMREVLGFAAAHAQARDAVHVPLDLPALHKGLHADGWTTLTVTSRAASREAYLRRPDWGRRLAGPSLETLVAAHEATVGPVDLAIVVADGLSALAAQRHAPPLLAALRRELGGMLRIAPIVLATQARVALADEVGQALHARAVLMLLGERPGLTSPDSLGAYMTWDPKVGRSDAERNCVSNIRPEGLEPTIAAQRIAWLLREAARRGLTGVALKDDSDKPMLQGGDPSPSE